MNIFVEGFDPNNVDMNKPIMTPEEFADRMKLLKENDDEYQRKYNSEYYGGTIAAHEEGDRIMCELLYKLGYSEGIKNFVTTGKYYC